MKKLPYLLLFCNFLLFTGISTQKLLAQDISSGLVGHWRFDGDLNDATSRGNHANSNNTPAFVAGVTGGSNNALSLDGSDQFLTIANQSDYAFGARDFTFSTWVKYNSVGSSMTLLDKSATDLGMCLFLDKNGDGVVTARTKIGNEVASIGPKINDGAWHLIVFSRETGMANGSPISILTLYIDGLMNNLSEFSTVDNISNNAPLYVAQIPTGSGESRYRGNIDDSRAYNRALTNGDISTLYKAQGVLSATEFTYFRDSDRDGFGDSNASIVTVNSYPPSGYVSNNKDCNDKDASINPNAIEICGNGVDENCDGIIETSVTGITGTNTVKLPTCLDTKGSITTIFNGLDPKTYKVILQDAVSGCVYYMSTVKLDPAAALSTPTVTVLQPTCNLATGTITFTNPTSGSTYSFDSGVTFVTDVSKSGLAPGVYRLCYRDNLTGCISKEIEVTINAAPIGLNPPTVSVTQPTCDVGTGTITVNSPSSGVTYSFDNGSSYQSSNVKSNLGAGIYTVRVKNSSDCVSNGTSATVNATISALFAPTLNVTQPTCTNQFGTISVVTTLVNVSYSYDRGVTFIAASSLSGLVPGTYYVCVRDNVSGCISKEAQAVINASPAGPSAPNVTATQPTCNNSLGSITVNSPLSNVTFSFDNGSSFQASNAITGLGVGTYNVRVKANGSGCVSNATSVTLSAAVGSAYTPVVSVSNPTCYISTGTITFTSPTSGVTYSFDGGVTFITQNFKSGLSPGTYRLCVRDNSTGCISKEVEAVVNPVPNGVNAPSVSVTQPTCLNNTGVISMSSSASGAVYSIDNGSSFQTANVRSGLAPGTYYVRVRNSSNCISPSVAVTINAAVGGTLTPTGTITQPTCAVPTGTITFTYPLSANYTYSYDGGVTFVPQSSRSGFAPGYYRLCVRDINTGCISKEVSATISNPPGVLNAPTVNILQPNCINALGSITVNNPSSGLLYSINNGASYQNSNVFNNLAAGTYYVKVKDSYCTSAATVVTLNPSVGLTFIPTVNVLQPNCTVSTGTISFNYPLGANYTYSYNGGATFIPQSSLSGLPSGTYRVCVREIYSGCISQEVTVIIDAPTGGLNAPNVSVSQPNCINALGSITVNNPSSGLLYSINNGASYQNSNVFNGLSAGTYYVKVKDSYCTSAATVVTLNPSVGLSFLPTVNVLNPTCSVSTGTITFTYPLGANYEYSYNGGATFIRQSSLSGLPSGNYRVCVREISTGCISQEVSVTISNPTSGLNAPSVITTQPNCINALGSIAVTNPSSGVLYSVDNGVNFQNSSVFSNLPAGTYYVKVKDSYCTSAATVVTLAISPNVTYTPIVNILQPSCSLTTGTITFTYPLGANYEYSYDGGATFVPQSSRAGFAPGSYRVCARAINTGCVSEELTVIITVATVNFPAPNLSIVQPTCNNLNGSITVINPVSGITYSFDNGVTFQASATIAKPAGAYQVRVKNSVGCVSSAATAQLDAAVSGVYLPTISVLQPTCAVPTGTITFLTPTTGFTYSYDGGVTFGPQISKSGLAPGDYRVCVLDLATGCISKELYPTINPAPTTLAAPIVTVTQPSCTTPYGTVVVTTPSSGVTYSFNNGASFQASATSPALASGSYNVIVKNSVGCISTATLVTIGAIPTIAAYSISAPSTSICSGTPTVLTVTPACATCTYQWSPGGATTSSITVSPVISTNYTVTVYNNGCQTTATKTITVASPVAMASVSVLQPNCTTFGKIMISNVPPGASTRIISPTFAVENAQDWAVDKAVYPNLVSGLYEVKIKLGCSESTIKVALYPELFRYIPGKCYKIVNFNSNKALSVAGMSMSDGAALTQNDYVTMGSQNWYFTEFNGLEKISARHSGKSVMAAGASVNHSTYVAGAGDWFIECIGGGRYRIQNKTTGRYLSVTGTSAVEGAGVTTTLDNGSDPSVHWYIVETVCAPGTDLIRENPSNTEGVKASSDNIIKDVKNAPSFLDETAVSTEILKNNVTKIQNARIFPNPANHFVEVQMDKMPANGFSVTILNALGGRVAEMKTQEGQTLRLNTEGLPNGLYIIQISEKGKPTIRKEIVIHN
jgi:Concanavalin A-like lectin/glucanases superfamily/Secretion system C-terminal sorting domain/Putative metal-binding motif/Ricin-type beta-trefoil lectin domain-like